MPLPSFTRQMIKNKFQEYCSNKIPKHIKNEIRLSYSIRGNSVTLWEERPVYFDPSEWSKSSVAQFRFSSKDQKWTLYCADRNSRWHEYIDTHPVKDIDILLKEVDEDPTGIFWG